MQTLFLWLAALPNFLMDTLHKDVKLVNRSQVRCPTRMSNDISLWIMHFRDIVHRHHLAVLAQCSAKLCIRTDAAPKEKHKIFDQATITCQCAPVIQPPIDRPLHGIKLRGHRIHSIEYGFQKKEKEKCRSGRGGNGEIIEAGKGKWVKNFKYRHNSGLKKEIWLPASEPADGQNGADVLLRVDPSVCAPCVFATRVSATAEYRPHCVSRTDNKSCSRLDLVASC
jgi:hypothetical protein